VAELTERPHPPGDYPVVVVGSGPGGLQVSYFLSRAGIGHAVISADPSPGGMFRRWPFFQRLLSWTKPYAAADRSSRDFERWDWNSLLADEPPLRGLQAEFLDGSSDFPARPEMEANLAAFAERASIAVAPRGGVTPDEVRAVLPGHLTWLDMPEVALRGTDLRARLRAGKSVRFMTPDPVWRYLNEEGLYV